MKPKSLKNRMAPSFRENDKHVIASISASPKAVVTVTKLWLVVLVGGLCNLTIIAKYGDKLPVALSLADA